MIEHTKPPTTRAELIDEVMVLRERVANQDRIIATLRKSLGDYFDRAQAAR